MTTTSPVTLAEAKAHLRIESNEEDAVIERLLISADQWWEKETATLLADLEEVPEVIKQAILFLVGHWFENRESATDRRIDAIPLALESIIAQFSKPEAV